MKNIAIILLLTIYSLSNLGMVINSHYCGGYLVSTSFKGNTLKKSCEMCGMKDSKNNCCKDKITKVSADDNQNIPDNNYNVHFAPFVALMNDYKISLKRDFAILNDHKIRFYVFETGPPKTPLYLQFRSILI